MGTKLVSHKTNAEQMREFEINLLNDVRTLEIMLKENKIESDIQRIGAEQELFIVDHHLQPAPLALPLLEKIDDRHFTTELAKFNLEFNLDPVIFKSNCFSQLERQILDLLTKAQEAAQHFNAFIALAGILPTIRKSDLDLNNMTPLPRYFALNDALTRLRGSDYILFLRGTEELFIKHDTVMLEACNTSFQVHFQVQPKDFARLYNISQAIAGPILAAACNSPLLFGKRLWHETRIAVFQHSVDTRLPMHYMRESMPRVSFGNHWVKESVLEIYREDISRFRVLISTDIKEDSYETLMQGGIPRLEALQLFNGSIYRWNRPCYGITGGKPHLRIENRILPAGPTVADEVANAAFWLGLVNGLAAEYQDITRHLSFDDAKTNFLVAARRGLNSQLAWINSQPQPAKTLIRRRLLPLAREGLKISGICDEDIERFLSIIDRRVSSGNTGAAWLLNSFNKTRARMKTDECLASVTKKMVQLQSKNKPVHTWPKARLKKSCDWKANHQYVEQFMTSDIFTVFEDDSIELVASLMDWQKVRHIPVEDHQNKFVGLVNYRSLLRYICAVPLSQKNKKATTPVKAIMQKDVPVVGPKTSTLEALGLMRQKNVSCLPVVREGRLVGILTDFDFLKIAAELLEERLK
ncbi:MAG: CBS domain-containing protein [Calditrichaeota bacterium]|nr:MAG: CBS domain-containing protein [Calditrichota bacterium]